MSGKHNVKKELDERFPTQVLLLGKPVMPVILLLIMLSMAAIGGLLFDTFRTLDRLAKAHIFQQVETALRVELHRQEQLVQEYAYWDESYEKLILDPDTEWADSNFGTFLFEDYGFDLVFAMHGDRRLAGLWIGGERVDLSALPRDESDAIALIDGFAASEEIATSGYLTFRGEPYRFGLEKFRDENQAIVRPDRAMLLFGRQLTQEVIDELSDTYFLTDLATTPTQIAADLTLLDFRENPVFRIHWDKETPAYVYFAQLLWPVILVFALMALLSAIILYRERGNRTQYVDQLFQMASKDFLTGISNRREFFFLANREMAHARRERKALSMMMMDLDLFKKVNDSQGHDTGDRILSSFAELVKQNLRDADVFARLGGEEFVALLVASNQHEAQEIAERLCDLVAHHEFRGARNQPVSCTVSIGVAEWNTQEAIDALLNRADDALYQSKGNGRNRVSVAAFGNHSQVETSLA